MRLKITFLRSPGFFTFKERQPLRWAANAVAWLLTTQQQAARLCGKCQERHYANLQWVRAIVQLPRTARTRVKHFGTERGCQKSLARAQLVTAPSHKWAAARNDNTIYRENTILAIEKKYIMLGACTLHNCVAARITGICAQMPSLEAALFARGKKKNCARNSSKALRSNTALFFYLTRAASQAHRLISLQ